MSHCGRQGFRHTLVPQAVAADWPSAGLERVTQCPACRSPSRALLYRDLTDENSHCAPGRWSLWRCSDCATAYLDPRPTRTTISIAYRAYYTHQGFGHEEVSRLGGLLFATVSAHPDANSLLDVGSGSGSLVLRARHLGWNAEGLEPDDAAVQAAQSRGAPTTSGTVDSLEQCAYDVVTMNHVIEHMHDPIDALRACCQALRPGGSLWLATPNVGSLGHRLFRTAWYGLDPPRHLAVYSEGGLAAALDAAGFARIEWRPSVGLSEALARVRRVLRYRWLTARAERSGGDVDATGMLRSRGAPMSRQVARHRATHAALRAAELVVPRTADELLLRAWPSR
jgi:SAM-dependent methyltransferase